MRKQEQKGKITALYERLFHDDGGGLTRACPLKTKPPFVKVIFSHKFVNQKNNALALLFLTKIRRAKALKYTAL